MFALGSAEGEGRGMKKTLFENGLVGQKENCLSNILGDDFKTNLRGFVSVEGVLGIIRVPPF